MSQTWRKACIKPTSNMRETLICLEESAQQIALVVNDEYKLIGVVTDGDIRRGILKGLGMDSLVTDFMSPNPQCASPSDSRAMILNRMRSESFHHMPVLDEKNTLVDLVLFENNKPLPNKVVLMAGGSGIRLRPLTTNLPKPMLHVGNRPILETIIDQLHNFGFKNFHISINYLGEKIEKYFGDGSKWGVSIDYLKERTPMGTVGALSLLENPSKQPIILMNSDLLTKLDFKSLLNFHNAHDSPLTLCVRDYDFVIPYGVIKTDGQRLLDIQEKPQESVLVNAGIYIVDHRVLDLIPTDTRIDATELIQILMENNEQPRVYPIHEYWIDIGQKQDFQRAENEFFANF